MNVIEQRVEAPVFFFSIASDEFAVAWDVAWLDEAQICSDDAGRWVSRCKVYSPDTTVGCVSVQCLLQFIMMNPTFRCRCLGRPWAFRLARIQADRLAEDPAVDAGC